MTLTVLRRRATSWLSAAALLACGAAHAQTVTYRQHVQPMLHAKCAECHGATAPTVSEFKLDQEKYKKAKEGPRTDTYEHLLNLIVYPETGALMRRLDDGTRTADGKPGNMHKYLGDTDAERAANLKLLRDWLGDDAWVMNRWSKRGDVPAVTKEQLDKLKLAY